MTLAALAVGAALAIAPGALAGQKNATVKRTLTKQQAAATKAAAPSKVATAKSARSDNRSNSRGNQNGRQRNQWNDRDHRNGHERGRNDNSWRRRSHDRGGTECAAPNKRHRDRGFNVDIDINLGHAPRVNYPTNTHSSNVIGTFTIDGHSVEVRKNHIREALIEAARCAGYQVCKVKVGGKTYIRIVGCPEVCFEGCGYTMDAIRYHNNVIDIAIFRAN